MVVPASPSVAEPAPLAVLAHRYGAGAPAVVELIRRTGGCTSPIRLEGESVAVSARSGAVLARRSTRAQAPGFVLVACGNRRESRCPPCSERYRRDAYFLVAAGLAGSEEKGVSTEVASHPLVFATFTAPSFGAVHRRVVAAGGGARPCRLGGQSDHCQNGIPMRCLERHEDDDPLLGQPLCPNCYDHEAAALWNANLGALWRRTITYLPRELAALSGLSVALLRSQVRIAYAKVAEFQARGAVHVHAVIRLDGPDGPDTAPAGGATAQRLAEAVARTAARVAVTVEGPGGRELTVRWGMQIDTRPINADRDAGDGHGAGVAGYLAKYATKDATSGGGLDRRIRVQGLIERAELSDHAHALMRSAWTLSPRWAHNLGFRGHFLTKARRYSVTFAALRGVRAQYRAQADPWLTQIRAKAMGDQVVIRASFHYAGSGLSPSERVVAESFRASPTSPVGSTGAHRKDGLPANARLRWSQHSSAP
ncbi:MAG: replication initiator [Candidatus Limnocylindrales bacterium]